MEKNIHRFNLTLPTILWEDLEENSRRAGTNTTSTMIQYLRLRMAVDQFRMDQRERRQPAEILVGNNAIALDILPSRYRQQSPKYHFGLGLPTADFDRARAIAEIQGLKFTAYALRAFAFGIEAEKEARVQDIPYSRLGLPIQLGTNHFLFI